MGIVNTEGNDPVVPDAPNTDDTEVVENGAATGDAKLYRDFKVRRYTSGLEGPTHEDRRTRESNSDAGGNHSLL